MLDFIWLRNHAEVIQFVLVVGQTQVIDVEILRELEKLPVYYLYTRSESVVKFYEKKLFTSKVRFYPFLIHKSAYLKSDGNNKLNNSNFPYEMQQGEWVWYNLKVLPSLCTSDSK